MVKINSANLKNNGFEPLDSGNYPAIFSKFEYKDGGEKASYYNITFTLDGEEYNNRKIFHKFFLTEKAMYRLNEFLGVLGVDTEDLESDDEDEEGVEMDDILAKEIGAKVTITVSPNNYVDRNGNEVHGNKIDAIKARELWD